MADELHIRAYDPADKTKLLEIFKLNVPQYFAETEIADLSNYLDHEIEKYYVVTLRPFDKLRASQGNHEIVGAGGINFENDYQTGKISWDFIHPSKQGMGIGRQLLSHRLAVLQSMGTIKNICVRTSQHAYLFYEKNGFILKEITQDYWAKGFHLYSMEYLQL